MIVAVRVIISGFSSGGWSIMRKRLFAAVLACLLVLSGVAFAGVQDFELVNATGVDIYEVYVSSVKTNSWEEDILGVDVLEDGDSVMINFTGHEGCKWDLMVKDSDGNSLTWENLNLCDISVVTLHWDGSKAWADLE
jgi:hypothetical protein